MKKQILGAAGLLTAGLIAGSAMAIGGANAAETTDSSSVSTVAGTTESTTTPNFAAGAPADAPDIFSPTSVRDDEENVTGDNKTKLEAAALAAVPGATVIRAETDADGGATYEVHLKKADGSVVTVEFDAEFKVIGTHDGFAKGGPHDGQPPVGGPGGHGPRGDHDGDDANGDDSTSGSTGGFTAPTVPSTTQNG